jgi:hypothetical protein
VPRGFGVSRSFADHAALAEINSARPAGRAMRLQRICIRCVPSFLFIGNPSGGYPNGADEFPGRIDEVST